MGESLPCFGILTAAGNSVISLSTGDKNLVIWMRLKGRLAVEIQGENKAEGQTVPDVT